MPDLGSAVHAALGQREVPRRLALDQIAGHGERPAAEPDERLLRLELARARFRPPRARTAPTPAGPGHEAAPRRRASADRLLDDRADPLDEIDLDPHPEHRQHDVGEHDRRVDAVDAYGLEGHLGAELGLAANLEQAVALANLAVAGKGAAGLPHEPDGRSLDRLEASSPDEKRRAHYNWAASWSSTRRKK